MRRKRWERWTEIDGEREKRKKKEKERRVCEENENERERERERGKALEVRCQVPGICNYISEILTTYDLFSKRRF